MTNKKKTVLDFFRMKETGEKFTQSGVYDFTTAMLAEQAGLEMMLVGDSMSMFIYGHDSTVPMTMDQMIYHSQAVRRGAPNTFVVGDMPFLSYQVSIEEAVRNAGRFCKEAGVDAVKLEGGTEMVSQVRAIVDAGMLVQGHIGITPQSAARLGGFRVQGNTAEAAVQVLQDAMALEQAGAFSILVEGVPPEVGKLVTQRVRVPILGTGAGPDTDGQGILVTDFVGLYPVFTPKFVKRYANVGDQIVQAVSQYVQEVKSGVFPGPEHCYKMKDGELQRLEEMLKKEG
ncbi:3-methyl-2-oxobutanoate hydroxymethyltransferase [Chloroflexota bacterium]